MKALILAFASFGSILAAPALSFAAVGPQNLCQEKAFEVVKAEIVRQLGTEDAVVNVVRQTNWVVVFSFTSERMMGPANPAGQIDALVSIKNIEGDDCEVGNASIDVYSSNG